MRTSFGGHYSAYGTAVTKPVSHHCAQLGLSPAAEPQNMLQCDPVSRARELEYLSYNSPSIMA